MTNQEAIEIIKIARKEAIGKTLQQEAFDMAIAALEKQIPIKPEGIDKCNNGMRFGWCPKCDCSQVFETADYCKYCGQRLDW